jgi:GTP-binding protein HflX
LVRLGPADGRLRALLFEQGAVVRENHGKQGGWELDVTLRRREYERLTKHEPTLASHWQERAEGAIEAG